MMPATVLEDVQRLLSSRVLDQVRGEPEPAGPLSQGILVDYLGELLRTGMEFPEQQQPEFECLHFSAGDHEFLCPLDRLHRIEVLDRKKKYHGRPLPGCEGPEPFALRLQDRAEMLYIGDVLGVLTVTHDEVLWRRSERRHPWFVGTHKSRLCRIFDPFLLFDASKNW